MVVGERLFPLPAVWVVPVAVRLLEQQKDQGEVGLQPLTVVVNLGLLTV